VHIAHRQAADLRHPVRTLARQPAPLLSIVLNRERSTVVIGSTTAEITACLDAGGL